MPLPLKGNISQFLSIHALNTSCEAESAIDMISVPCSQHFTMRSLIPKINLNTYIFFISIQCRTYISVLSILYTIATTFVVTLSIKLSIY